VNDAWDEIPTIERTKEENEYYVSFDFPGSVLGKGDPCVASD